MRFGLKTRLAAALSALPLLASGEVPRTVEETWAAFDPAAEPLETEVIGESIEDGVVVRQVRYVVGTFQGRKARVAAFYGFAEGGVELPGMVQLHGGGQRAMAETVRFWASHGYAAIAVNWGEYGIGEQGDGETDWAGIEAGFLDPKHHNDVSAGEGTLYAEPHPWNSSWLLYAAAARRAVSFLERQREVDGTKIGVTGHSMGGRLAVLTAIDPRIKAASPSVGGSGYLYSDLAGVPGSARTMKADRELYDATVDGKGYWPLIRCPLLFLGATNDFNSPMELVLRGFATLPGKDGAMSFTPHMNHRFTADNYAARIRWFETHLKGNFDFPRMATAQLDLATEDGIPRFRVRPDLSGPHELEKVGVYYGYERDPRVRFWRSAEVAREGDVFVAACPVMERSEPLFVFANVTYDTGSLLAMPRGYEDTTLLTITSECRQAFPHQLERAGVRATGDRQRLLEDFTQGWRDWSVIGAGHSAHWHYETHKPNDPAFAGPRGASLALEIETSTPGETLAVVLETDGWRGYTGRKTRQYIALAELEEAGAHSVELPVDRFVTKDGELLENYDFVTSLILTPAQKAWPERVSREWQGKVPAFGPIRWVGGEFAPRPRTYLGLGASEIDADRAFLEQFDRAVDESVEREARDRN